jgi:transposase-like protein
MDIVEYIILAFGFANPRVCPKCKKPKSFYETGTYNKKGSAQYRCRKCHYETFSKPDKRWDYDEWHYR